MGPRSRLISAVAAAAIVLVALAAPARATEYFVAPGGVGNGSGSFPFGRIQDALDAARPGDVITAAPGTYAESLSSVRGGSPDAPITLRAAVARTAIVTRASRILTVSHAYLVVDGLVLDGQYAPDDTVRVTSSGNFLVLRNTEVRRSSRDLIDMAAPVGVLIEGSLLHHALNAAGGRTDAHGIVAGAVRDLTIRDTEIHTFSGDGVQVDPDRAAPGWDRVTIEGSKIWLAPLPGPENGFAAGAVPGENAVDTKAAPTNTRSRITVRDTVASGFRGGFINNMAAFNFKEYVDATVDGVTVFDSEIAFRLRGPTTGALVLLRNAVVYNVTTAFRYEDNIQNLRLWNSTVGLNVSRAFQAASAPKATLDVRNLLSIPALSAEASSASNLRANASSFVDASAHDYHLVAASPAVDGGERLDDVTIDRDGLARPQGSGYDVGAYERAPTTARGQAPATGPAGTR
ncbi:MAG TPA: choice-of-anchor Q domain-containing protein [Vicinamibacterales bacterium]|nr:choice-of-anchor Q domain-containing protein [Vicinamibacterales bacterium]